MSLMSLLMLQCALYDTLK